MNKLNEKLAKWAGFELDNRFQGLYWNTRTNYWEGLPNFTNSLDACFRWLVPRLEKDYWIIIDPPNKTVIIVYGFVQEAEGIGETSALALCRAIEKIIDDA